jgi:cell division protein FtsQ
VKPRWGRIAVAVGLLLALIGGGVVWYSPLFAVRQVTVEGARDVSDSDIVTALAVADGTPLLRVDTAAAAARVERIPRVASCHVQVDFPSTIRVTVRERAPLVFFENAQGAHLVDSTGVEYALAPAPPDVPRLRTAHPGPNDPDTKAALTVLVAVPDPLRAQIQTISARTISDITLTLRDGRVVQWGGTADSVRKAAITGPMLSQPGHTFDVSSPDLPTIK